MPVNLNVVDRRGRRGRRYALTLILLVVVLAKLAGEDRPAGIAHWVRARTAFFCKAFDLPRPVRPCANTYRWILGEVIAAEELEAHFRRFLAQRPADGTALQVAVDGKTVRGTIACGASQGLHRLAAYQVGRGVVLMQVTLDGHENEISAAPRVLERLDLQGKIITGDALLAQRELSEWIVNAGGDYVWTVKDNQPQLRADIEHQFEPDVPLSPGF